MKLEDIIVKAINGGVVKYGDDVATIYVEFKHGSIEGRAYVTYDKHDEYNYIDVDGCSYLESTNPVIDGLSNIEIECWDEDTNKDVAVNEEYIISQI